MRSGVNIDFYLFIYFYWWVTHTHSGS